MKLPLLRAAGAGAVVAPRAGAWIETGALVAAEGRAGSPPARGRGLKRRMQPRRCGNTCRPPRGGVD